MSEVEILAKNIEIDNLHRTVTRLSQDLAQMSIESRNANGFLKETLAEARKNMEDMSATNLTLLGEKKGLEEAYRQQQIHLQEMDDDLTGVRHQLERERIISAHIFKQTKSGSSLIYLPNHFSLGKKVKKSDLVIRDFDVRQLPEIVTQIDEMYRRVDNKELRELLK